MMYEPLTQIRLSRQPSTESWSPKIAPGSRYEGFPVVRAPYGEATVPVVLDRALVSPTRYTVRPVSAQVRPDQLAARALGDPKLWWRLADLNPERFWPDFPPGSTVRVPQ